MYVCLQIEHRIGVLSGAWYELGHDSDEIACVYREKCTKSRAVGEQVMAMKPVLWSWRRYWRDLAERITPLYWFEVASVDDDCDPNDLIHDIEKCHPQDAIDNGKWWAL